MSDGGRRSWDPGNRVRPWVTRPRPESPGTPVPPEDEVPPRAAPPQPFDTGPEGHWMPPAAAAQSPTGDGDSPWAPAAPAGPPPTGRAAWGPAPASAGAPPSPHDHWAPAPTSAGPPSAPDAWRPAPTMAGPTVPPGAPGPHGSPGVQGQPGPHDVHGPPGASPSGDVTPAPGDRRRKRLVIAGVVLVVLVVGGVGALWLVGGGDDAERDGSGEIVAGGDLSAFSVREGDCWNDPPLDQEVETVVAVPCAEPHDAEVYAVYDLELDEYPGDDEIGAAAEAGCLERFTAFAGIDYAASTLDVVFLNPTQESFDREDDRSVICSVSDPEGPATGSLRGAAR